MNCLVIEDREDRVVYRVFNEAVKRVFGGQAKNLCPGKEIEVAFLGGSRGRARIVVVTQEWIDIEVLSTEPSLPLQPIDLLVGLSRPQTSRKVLQAAVMAGVRSLHFIKTIRGEKSYVDATLFREDSIHKETIKALEQVGQGLYPDIRVHRNFDYFVKHHLPSFSPCEGKFIAAPKNAVIKERGRRDHSHCFVLAIGPEAGWSSKEVSVFEAAGFSKIGLGDRVVRVEVAVSMLLGQVMMLNDY